MTDELGEPHGAEPDADTSGRSRNPYFVGALALTVVATICAAVFGGLWASTALSGASAYSHARDTVLRVGKGAAVNLTTVDYRHLDAYQQTVEKSTTGALHDSVSKSLKPFRKQLAATKIVVDASVLQAAVSSLDTHQGKASVIVVVKTVTRSGGAHPQQNEQSNDGQSGTPSSARRSMVLNMTRVANGDWKVSMIGGRPTSSGIPGQ